MKKIPNNRKVNEQIRGEYALKTMSDMLLEQFLDTNSNSTMPITSAQEKFYVFIFYYFGTLPMGKTRYFIFILVTPHPSCT